MIQIEKHTLKNGLRVILIPQKESPATTVAVLVQAGSKYETKDINGISHFLEHMCFKGTKNRPHDIDISSELDGLGAEYNAFTGHEYTSYFAKVRNEASNEALDIVTDLYINPVFNKGEIEKERGVIIEERNMYEDMPKSKVHDLFMELVYGDQPVGWSIVGTKENILKFQRKDFISYRNRNYLPQSTVLVISGGFEIKDTLKKVEKYFNRLPSGKKQIKEKVKEVQKRPGILTRYKESDQSHMVLGVRAFDMFDKRRFALQVLSDVLGGGMSSRLFQKVRGEMGAAYYVYSIPDLYTDHGLLSVSAGINHEKLPNVIKAVLNEFNRFVNEDVSKKELEKAKEHIVGKLSLSIETSDELAYFYGEQEIFGFKQMSPEQIAKNIKDVNASDVRSVAKNIFKNDRLNFALISPLKDKTFSDIVNL